MSIDSEHDLLGMQHAGKVVAEALKAMQNAIEPGVTPAELDEICGQVFRKYGAESAPRQVYGAPVHAFISVNEDVVHGLPTPHPLKAGDVVKLDVTPNVQGYIADAAITVAVPPASPQALKLIACAEAAFQAAMRVATAGKPIHVIGRAIEQEVTSRGFTVLRELSGHSVGKTIHEQPSVLNYYHPRDRYMLHEGLVLAIEPLISAGRRGRVKTLSDGWTLSTTDGSLSAHFEHTVVITQGKPMVLTA
ncbi:type I methionyl aminopeptidase [Deinococcus roseus]|uniref:Methionine aminopeptidase n=1 Tax=Deinococcus roseus TaxID=392414 RepID=A0ABQ2D8C7_9DEIO|nr:type I methionyl aminopeptidase [Deinococcus roseus]GGJ49643.1 methionine aminopeptidase 2 [Deinococcus roseus]